MDSVEQEGGCNSMNAVKGAALLLIIGEPFSEDHKKLILAEVSKGFACWDTELIGFDINDELAQIANSAALGEEGPNGERIIRHHSDNLAVEIIINPRTVSVTNSVKNFLSLPTKHKHLIYAGHAFQGTGAWILQDDTYSFDNFAHVFKDIDNTVRQQHGTSLYIYTGADGDWSSSQITKSDFAKILDVKLNPASKMEILHGVLQFTAYVSNFVRVRPLNELLQSSDVVGSIRFTRPTLYIFPACQGDSALFGISGFNLLINGGYSRKACFWDFTRHLDRIDAALITHLGTDNLYGTGSVLQRKSAENVHPEIGYMYVNAFDKIKAHTEFQNEGSGKEESLLVNLAEEGDKLVQYAKHIGLAPQPCSRSANSIEPINLYQKVGIGSLDMYILNPITDSKELKDFYHQWNQKVAQFGKTQQLSLPNILSVCALLVWRPADPDVNIIRILFPGNAPQHKILEGLEKLKTLDILKHASCTKISLTAKPAAKKPPVAGLFTKPTKSKASPISTPRNETPKSEVSKKETKDPGPPKTSSTPKRDRQEKQVPLQKVKKEDVNKKTMKVPEKQKHEKLEKSKQIKPATPSSPTKGPAKSSTFLSKKPKSAPVKPVPVNEVNVADHTPAAAESVDITASGHLDNDKDTHMEAADIKESVQQTHVVSEEPESMIDVTASNIPEPDEFAPESEQIQESRALDKEKMRELGIYDEDQDIEDEYDDEPESEEKPKHRYGGMEDSMHEDLLGEIHQDAMQGSFHGDPMTGSIHESMFDKRHPFEDQGYMQNGDNILTPEDETSEEIQPQALPEPVAYAHDKYIQEPDVIPTISGKEESHITSCEDSPPRIKEPDLLPVKQDLYDLDMLNITTDDHVQNFDYSSASLMDNKHEQPLVETADEIANVSPQECVKSIEDIAEKDFEESQQVNVSTRFENVDKDMIETFLEINEPSYSTGDFELPSPNDKEYPSEVPESESFVDEQDLLMHSRSDTNELIEPSQELQDHEDEDLSHVQDAIERPQSPLPEESEQKLFDVMDEERFQHVTVENKYEQFVEDHTAFTDNPEQDELEQNKIEADEEERISSAEEKEHIDDFGGSDDNSPEKQEFEIPEAVSQASLTNTDLLEFALDQNDDHIDEADDKDMIEIDSEDSEDETKNELLTERNVPSNLHEMQDSDDERAESPDSQLGMQDISRDSLEKEYIKKTSLSPEPEDDAKMYSGYPEDETENVCDNENVEEDQLEEGTGDLEQTQNGLGSRESMERETEPHDVPAAASPTDSDQQESADQSYEDESDKTEDDDDNDESSSSEQEEATDEKHFIQDSTSEDQKDLSQRPFEVNSHTAQGDSIAQKTSGYHYSPELEETYPSCSGQMDYHQQGDQASLDPKNDSDQGNSDTGGPEFNPLYSDQASLDHKNDSDQDNSDTGGPEFNPLVQWGNPMGLPFPAPPEVKTEGVSTAAKNSPASKLASKMNGTKKTDEKRPDAKKPALQVAKKSASAQKPAVNNVLEKAKVRLSTDGPGANLNSPISSAGANSSKVHATEKAAATKAAPKSRAVSAPNKDKGTSDSKPKQNGTKRATTANGFILSPAAVKMPPLPPFSPYYFDLAYIPNHGDSNYCDVEFFKRVRARYYVLSALSPSTHVLDVLQEGKKTWEDKTLPTTLIPTYDNENLRLWMTLHKDKLAEDQIEIAPSASRCTIQLQDHETSSSAYRLEF